MLTREAKRTLTAMAMLAMPTGLVWAAGMLIGGPREVHADSMTPAIVLAVPDVAPALDEAASQAQREAAVHIWQLRNEPFEPTPLYHHQRPADSGKSHNPGPDIAPIITVQAIMSSPTGSVALIDGDWLRIGDPIGKTAWYLLEIEGDARSVTIRDRETGNVRTQKVRGPGR